MFGLKSTPGRPNIRSREPEPAPSYYLHVKKNPPMDFRLNPILLPSSITSGQIRPVSDESVTPSSGAGQSFKAVLDAVSKSQNESQQLQREVQLGNPQVGIEEAMVAMQKSQVHFQAALHVRNRLVQAYSDIMNMQV